MLHASGQKNAEQTEPERGMRDTNRRRRALPKQRRRRAREVANSPKPSSM
jgi:hypothetical protein